MSNKPDNKESIDNIIETTFSHIRDIVDANTIVGKPIELKNDLYIIPVSKISVGLVTGGGNLPKSKKKEFSAGSGTGFNIEPVGFVTISDDVSYIPVGTDNFEKNIIELMLKVYDKFANKGEEDDKEEV